MKSINMTFQATDCDENLNLIKRSLSAVNYTGQNTGQNTGKIQIPEKKIWISSGRIQISGFLQEPGFPIFSVIQISGYLPYSVFLPESVCVK